MSSEFPHFSPEDLKKALINQGEMLKNGADVNEEGVLIATEEQIKQAHEEMIADRPEAKAEIAETEQKVPETLIWTPVNLRKAMTSQEIEAFNTLVSEQTDWDKGRRINMGNFKRDYQSRTGKPLDDNLASFLEAFSEDRDSYNQLATFWQTNIGEEIYSKRQREDILNALGSLNRGEFPHGKSFVAIYTLLLRYNNQVSQMPDLPVASREQAKAGDFPASKPVESVADVRPVEIKQPEAAELPRSAAVKPATPESTGISKLQLLEYVVKQERGMGKRSESPIIPESLKQEHPLASKYFEIFLPIQAPNNLDEQWDLVGDLYARYLRSEQKITSIRKNFEEAGLVAGFDAVRQFVNDYWATSKRNYTETIRNVLDQNLESDSEFKKLPSNVQALILEFNRDVYGVIKLESQNQKLVLEKIDRLMKEKGVRAFEVKKTREAMIDVFSSDPSYEYTLEEKPSYMDSNCFGINGPDGNIYLLPASFATNLLVYERFNRAYKISRDGSFPEPSKSSGEQTPFKVLKPSVLRPSGKENGYTLREQGIFIATT